MAEPRGLTVERKPTRMRLSEVAEALEAEVIVGEERLDTEVPAGGASDMVSDLPSSGDRGWCC